ncbi:MAG: hypothetical protein JO362_02020 [Streptomycetaceae bacterium]|nr:hypothetical protein [Streptomycetaceae bacterium]
MFRMLSAAAVTGSALAALTLIGVGAASAAPVLPGHSRAAANTGLAAQASPVPNDWVLRDKYWTYDGCNSAGLQGVQRGAWDQYQCANGTLQWVLWTNR